MSSNFTAKVFNGLFSLLQPRYKILAYHSVDQESHDPFEISADSFEKQILFLVSNKYNVISLEDAYRNMMDHTIQDKTVVITFDDGMTKLKKYAFPVLKHFELPATVFLPVKYIGGIDKFSYDEPKADRAILNWKSIEDSMTEGISYASHTMSHPRLVSLDEHALRYELYESRMILEGRLGLRFHPLAYPFGVFDERVKAAARINGYDCALCINNATSNTKDTDLFEMKRETLHANTTLKDFSQLVDIRNDFSRGTREFIRSVLMKDD